MAVVNLPSIPVNADVFVDANVLIYAVLGKSNECHAFLARLGTDVAGYSDAKVFHDCMHKLMLAESGKKSAGELKKYPALIKTLTKWKLNAELIRKLPIEWIDMDTAQVGKVPAQATADGLLCGDALIRVNMSAYGINAIVSNDIDFEKLGCTVYAPTDLVQ